MIKVVINTGKKSKEKQYFYRNVDYDAEGWADAKKWLPADYDLVYMKIRGKPTIVGWSVGKEWLGLRLKDGDVITSWRRKPDELNHEIGLG
jgi:hypothetical protein